MSLEVACQDPGSKEPGSLAKTPLQSARHSLDRGTTECHPVDRRTCAHFLGTDEEETSEQYK